MESSLYALALLACPVGMGLMMFIMMRRGRGTRADQPSVSTDRAQIDALRAEIDAFEMERAATPQEPKQP